MKIIFLDIDGVLNVIPKDFDKYGGTFHEDFVENLRHMIKETGAKIVISSTWRLAGLKAMQEMWKFRDLPGEVIGITPDSYFNKDLGISDDDDASRGHEIKWWLDNTKDVIDNYVILDDDTDFLESQLTHFVQTSKNPQHPDSIDIGYGLTKHCTELGIKILNKK